MSETEQERCFKKPQAAEFGAGGNRFVLMILVIVILGVLAGAESVNVFMLARLAGSVNLARAPVIMRRTSSNKIT